MAVEYNQHTWGYGEELTPDKLNNIEGGVKATAEAVNEVNNNLTSKLDFFNLSNYDNSGILNLSKNNRSWVTSNGIVIILHLKAIVAWSSGTILW